MNIEEITEGTVKTFDILNTMGLLYLDDITHELTFVGNEEHLTRLTTEEFEKILSYYRKYRRYVVEGGSCTSCNAQRKGHIADQFKEYVAGLKKKYYEI